MDYDFGNIKYMQLSKINISNTHLTKMWTIFHENKNEIGQYIHTIKEEETNQFKIHF